MNKNVLEGLKSRISNLLPIENHLSIRHAWRRYISENNKLMGNLEDFYLPRAFASEFPNQGIKLYRVTDQFDGLKEDLIQFFHHPCSCKTKTGRCNISRFPVFYCSDFCDISLAEAVQNKLPIFSKIYYISVWVPVVQKKWKILPFVFDGLPKGNPLYEYGKKNKENLLNLYNKYRSDDHVANQLIEFFHSEFTNLYNHSFSSIVAHQYLYDNDNCEGDIVAYPSVQSYKMGNNYAINKKHIEQGNIALEKVYKVHIEYMSRISEIAHTFSGNLISVGSPLDETFIQWQNPNEEDYKTYKEKLIRLI